MNMEGAGGYKHTMRVVEQISTKGDFRLYQQTHYLGSKESSTKEAPAASAKAKKTLKKIKVQQLENKSGI